MDSGRPSMLNLSDHKNTFTVPVQALPPFRIKAPAPAPDHLKARTRSRSMHLIHLPMKIKIVIKLSIIMGVHNMLLKGELGRSIKLI